MDPPWENLIRQLLYSPMRCSLSCQHHSGSIMELESKTTVAFTFCKIFPFYCVTCSTWPIAVYDGFFLASEFYILALAIRNRIEKQKKVMLGSSSIRTFFFLGFPIPIHFTSASHAEKGLILFCSYSTSATSPLDCVWESDLLTENKRENEESS